MIKNETTYINGGATKVQKTPAEKKLIAFRNQLHTLLIRNPEIRIAGDMHGDVVAFIVDADHPKVYLPKSGNHRD